MSQGLFITSYILQAVGFVGITLAWIKAIHELRLGTRVYRTRLLMLGITTVAFFAYLFPAFASVCYFVPDCFQPVYRDYLRLTSGLILFLYGLFNFILYYTKDPDMHEESS